MLKYFVLSANFDLFEGDFHSTRMNEKEMFLRKIRKMEQVNVQAEEKTKEKELAKAKEKMKEKAKVNEKKEMMKQLQQHGREACRRTCWQTIWSIAYQMWEKKQPGFLWFPFDFLSLFAEFVYDLWNLFFQKMPFPALTNLLIWIVLSFALFLSTWLLLCFCCFSSQSVSTERNV